MNPWIYWGVGLVTLWLQVSLAPYLSVFGTKPNLMLIVLLLVGLRWIDPWLFVPAALTGLALDAFSHGVLGVYGISFFLISFATRYVGFTIYENSLWFILLAVGGLSLLEGTISLTLFEMLEPQTQWLRGMFRQVLPLAIYHGIMAPLLFALMLRLERLLKLEDALRPKP